MGHSVPQQSAQLCRALPKSGNLAIENVGLRADPFGRQIGNPKDTAGQVGTAIHNVHIEMIGKLRLTAGAALLEALVFAAAQHPTNVYAGFREDIRGGLLSTGKDSWGHVRVVEKGNRESVGRGGVRREPAAQSTGAPRPVKVGWYSSLPPR